MGDVEAWAALYERYWPRLFRLAAFVLWDRERARDLAQDTFARAIPRLGGLRNDRAFGPWLCKITGNLLRDELRKRSTERKGLGVRGPFDDAEQVPDPAASPDVENIRDQERIRACLGRLPENLRTPLLLRLEVGLNALEIAAALGIKPAAARKRLTRARDLLKKCMNGRP